ncbi:hypothetical protein [Streptomyces sp. NPDC048282]|uniref:hypothetical protein n=1 Tax=unclassified Streptomyces TaxID=2593676 RepID=UPI0037162E45
MTAILSAQNDAGGNPDRNLIGGELITLEGLRLKYRYSTGREYLLTFDADRVVFQMLNGEDLTARSIGYRARRLRDDQYVIGWVRVGDPEAGRPTFAVTLVVDFQENKLYASALMDSDYALFDEAELLEVTRP